MPKSIFNPSRRGRRYSPAFKARLIEQCSQPGVVLTAVAQENGVSVPTLQRWLEEAGPLDDASGNTAPGVAADMQQSPWPRQPAFIPIDIPAKVSGRTEAGSHIRIKIRRDAQQLTIEWPAHAARECGAWLSALLS